MISVIICTYNREKYIYHVLESIAKNNFPHNQYEIVLVNNNCTDNTSAEVQRFQQDYPEVALNYCSEHNQGLSFARNKGIDESTGDILIYVDDDAFVNSSYLSNYSELFSRHKDIFAAGGPIIPYYETHEEPSWMTYHLKRLLTGYLFFGNKERDFPNNNYPGGGNAAYRAEVFSKIGGFNVNLGRNGGNLGGGEEKDIFQKMKVAGMRFIYTPGSILYHSIPQYKLEEDYFQRVTCGIGESERIRTLSISHSSYWIRILKEFIKWGGTIILWIRYCVTFKPECGKKLIQFRWNVTKKLLGK